MFRKKEEDAAPAKPQPKADENAYEDNWYRSLKALSARSEPKGDDEEETPEASE